MKGSGGKSPAVQWYYKDWLSDRKLQRACPSSRGIWMNLLMHMLDCSLDSEDCKEGMLEDVTIAELMQLGSCNEDEAWQFIDDALKHQFCDIELDKCRTVHIMSRRLSRDVKKREYWRNFKRLQREKLTEENECPTDVQPESTLSPIPTPTPTPNNNNKYSANFLKFWSAYPIKKGKGTANKAWKKLKPDLDVCLAAIKNQTAERIRLKSNGGFCPEWKNPTTWLNGECWDDETETDKDEWVSAER